MNFSQVIGTLSKSSSSAVSTLDSSKELQTIKNYLYIETGIEKDFAQWLNSNSGNKRVLFLCGSSGDGKSEILTRYHERYKEAVSFHLDGTHSYHPTEGAIETLDKQFTSFKDGQKPLVVGINIGMLGNYAQEGVDAHGDIKGSMSDFLSYRTSGEVFQFLSFDDYPKYKMNDGEVQAPFVEELLARICSSKDSNPFYSAYKEAKGKLARKSRSLVNYELLSLPEVRAVVVKLILQARLQFNLFLTARTLLDAVYHMLSDKDYLFDNLFQSTGGELMESLSKLDPNRDRKRDVDMFLIQQALGIEDESFLSFQDSVAGKYGIHIRESASWLRLCYLLRGVDLGNDFHRGIIESFDQNSLKRYIDQWVAHNSYLGEREQRKSLREFYTKTFLKALRRYANRRSPKLGSQHFFLKELNGYVFASKVKVEADFKSIESNKPRNLGSFELRLLVEGKGLAPITVDAGLFDLICRINHGYRPNKYDKSSIVILEELIEVIQSVGNTLGEMVIERSGKVSTAKFDQENEEISIEGAL